MSLKTLQEKKKSTQSSFPKKIIYKTKTIPDVHLIPKNFNSCFTKIGPNLANKIEKSSKNFEGYIKKSSSIQSEHPISINELKDCFGALHKPLLHVLNLSTVKEIFPDDLKIAHVIPVFKGGDEKDLGY